MPGACLIGQALSRLRHAETSLPPADPEAEGRELRPEAR